MKIYNYHYLTFEYLGESEPRESPLEPGVFIIPAQATEIIPPEEGAHEKAVFVEGASEWKIVADYRGSKYWTSDGAEHEIKELGEEPPEDALDKKPEYVPTLEDRKREFNYIIKRHLDAFANKHDWDNIEAAILQINSEYYKDDAVRAQQAYDEVWELAINIQQDFLDEKITTEEVVGRLPVLEW